MVYSRAVLMTFLTVGAASTSVLAAPVTPVGAGGTEAPPTSMGKPNTVNTGDGAPMGPGPVEVKNATSTSISTSMALTTTTTAVLEAEVSPAPASASKGEKPKPKQQIGGGEEKKKGGEGGGKGEKKKAGDTNIFVIDVADPNFGGHEHFHHHHHHYHDEEEDTEFGVHHNFRLGLAAAPHRHHHHNHGEVEELDVEFKDSNERHHDGKEWEESERPEEHRHEFAGLDIGVIEAGEAATRHHIPGFNPPPPGFEFLIGPDGEIEFEECGCPKIVVIGGKGKGKGTKPQGQVPKGEGKGKGSKPEGEATKGPGGPKPEGSAEAAPKSEDTAKPQGAASNVPAPASAAAKAQVEPGVRAPGDTPSPPAARRSYLNRMTRSVSSSYGIDLD